MTPLSAQDKISLAKFLESSTVTLASLQALQGLIKDDGLRKLCEAAIGMNEAQIKGVQGLPCPTELHRRCFMWH